MEQKIKQDIHIGADIWAVRKVKKMGPTEPAGLAQLEGVSMIGEALVKIECGNRRIQASWPQAIKNVPGTVCGELLERQDSRGTEEWTS